MRKITSQSVDAFGNGNSEFKHGFVSYGVDVEEKFDDEGEELDGEEYVLIEKIEVDEEMRGKGLGRKYLSESIKNIEKEHPGLPIRLAALPDHGTMDMSDLVYFYETEGFDVTNTAGDAVVMEFTS